MRDASIPRSWKRVSIRSRRSPTHPHRSYPCGDVPSWRLVTSLALVAGCGTQDKPADTPADQAPAAAEPAAPAGPGAIVTVIYNHPKDTAAFEKYYREVHLPLVSANQQEIGFTRADLTKFASTVDGKKPAYYRQAELYFPSLDAAKKGMATRGLQEGG